MKEDLLARLKMEAVALRSCHALMGRRLATEMQVGGDGAATPAEMDAKPAGLDELGVEMAAFRRKLTDLRHKLRA